VRLENLAELRANSSIKPKIATEQSS